MKYIQLDRAAVGETIYGLLVNLQQSLNPKEPMTDAQLFEAASLLMDEFRDLTFSEIVYAFKEFKLGKLINDYGRLNIKVLADALTAYRSSDERLTYLESRHKKFEEPREPKPDPGFIKDKVAMVLERMKPKPVAREMRSTEQEDLAVFSEMLKTVPNAPENIIPCARFAASYSSELYAEVLKAAGPTQYLATHGDMTLFTFYGKQFKCNTVVYGSAPKPDLWMLAD